MRIPEIVQAARQAEQRRYLVDLLVELCRIDTTPRAAVQASAQAEAQTFALIESHLRRHGIAGGKFEHRPINPAIAQHPFYSQPYYTQTPAQPQGLSVQETYRDRGNFVWSIAGQKRQPHGINLALNAHIDVVKPYIPPRVEGRTVFGRGSCDDKGPVVAILGAMKLVGAYLRQKNFQLNRNLVGMFVIEEETGGNGSLSLALDYDLRQQYDSIVVCECAGNNIHPGNRGAVWYKVEARLPGVNLFEVAAFIIEEMEKEGRAIKAQSDHPLFPHRPVQTCHGVIGGFGEHPSRICGRVDFTIACPPNPTADRARLRQLITDFIDDSIAQYVDVYGDKTKVRDPATNKPKVDHHYDLTESSVAPGSFTVAVHGATGHMGSILLNDGAITKMAGMVRALVAGRTALERAAGGKIMLGLRDGRDAAHLVLEGGQGFLSTHSMEEVQQRLRQAVWRGAEHYLRLIERTAAVRDVFQVTYDKLHNAAFAGAADSPSMRHAVVAAQAADMWKDGPVRGWDVSCDARLFACAYPDLTVLTTGPGQLIHAHADDEQIDIDELATAAEFLAYFILFQTGTVTP